LILTTSLRPRDGSLFAISDLHVTTPQNRVIVEGLRSERKADWLLVAGDISEDINDVEWALNLLTKRFATVVWVPGNHELWTPRHGPQQWLRGTHRYEQLVAKCRTLGVITPEDSYPVWHGTGGPARIVPLFLLYDYTFAYKIAATKEAALERAWAAGVVCSDEFMLHPDPYPSRAAWCEARVTETERRLAECDLSVPTILVNHFPLTEDPTRSLRRPEFAQWCGTVLTADWHTRFNAAAVVYGHLHIPHTARRDGVRFEEVSLGYAREWGRRGGSRALLRRILPIQEL